MQDTKQELTLCLLGLNQGPFASSVDQDQTARSVQYDLGSTLPDQEVLFFKNINLKLQHLPLNYQLESFISLLCESKDQIGTNLINQRSRNVRQCD